MTASFSRLAIIVGAMKSGTSSLFSYLRQHPQIAASKKKEPNFFTEGDLLDLSSYYALWEFDPSQHRVALEGSTNYTKAPQFGGAFALMKQTPFDFRFLYILRDPIDRLESHIKHSIATGRALPKSYHKTLQNGLAVSRYASQIDCMLEHFRRDQLLLLSFDRLCQDPQPVLDEVCQFLGIDLYTCQNLSPRNQKLTASVGPWSLPAEERVAAYHQIADDLQRLQDVYGFDITNFTCVRQYQTRPSGQTGREVPSHEAIA